ncbi:MAG: hypothetical protein H0X29_03510 [Parachlamydiaceae bacterium]|nr:hypothetical protein [Parachlamydiaceae bacterium]
MRIIRLALFLILIFPCLYATELLPWYGNTLEIETRAAFKLQGYHSVATDHHSIKRPACDLFFELSAGTSYDDYAAELEILASDTRYRNLGLDCIKLTGRYRLLNDIVADPVSLVSGITISQVFKPGLRNLSSFHHGGIEAELHLSAGKEHSFMQFWTSRYWGVIGVGGADMGYPWVRGDVAWEHNYCELHQVRLFANSLWGLGHESLKLKHHFHGYGPIRHQCIDIGLRYSKFFPCNGLVVSLEYAFRIFARNCPKEMNSLYLSLNYPFGL